MRKYGTHMIQKPRRQMRRRSLPEAGWSKPVAIPPRYAVVASGGLRFAEQAQEQMRLDAAYAGYRRSIPVDEPPDEERDAPFGRDIGVRYG